MCVRVYATIHLWGFFYSFSLSLFLKYEKTWIKGGGEKNWEKVTVHILKQFSMHGRERHGRRERGGRKRERLKSLKWGALIMGPRRCLSRQPFPGTLLEMSTAGNWIRLAVRVEPRLTDAQTGETLKWQMFPLLLKPECKAVTSRYRLSDEVWGLWQSSGLLKSMSIQRREGARGEVTDAVRKASPPPSLVKVAKVSEKILKFSFFDIKWGACETWESRLQIGLRGENAALMQITIHLFTILF